MPIYNPQKQFDVSSDKKPENSHLTIQLDSKNIIFVDSDDNTKVYHLNTSTNTLTQLDVDPGDASGDNKSRIYKVQAFWHDRDNKIIWGVDCENDVETPSEIFSVWKLDYSVSETSPTVTEVGTQDNGGSNLVFDIWIDGANTYVIGIDDDFNYVVWDVDTAPFTEKDTLNLPGTPTNYGSFGVLVGTVFYMMVSIEDVPEYVSLLSYDSGTDTLALVSDGPNDYVIERTIGTRQFHAVSYDGSDILYFILTYQDDSKNYLVTYSITGDSFTVICEFNVSLMLDRNTDSSANPPFNLEKGFGAGTDNKLMVYQIPSTYLGWLWKIADLTNAGINSGEIVAITDKFIFIEETDGNIELWEFVSADNYILDPWVYHQERDYPRAEILYNAKEIYFEKDMFIQIIGTLTSNSVTTENTVIFEGFIIDVEEYEEDVENLKIAYFVSPAIFDLEQNFPSQSVTPGDTDEHLKELREDTCNYITEGTISDGGSLNNTKYQGGNSYGILLTQFSAFDQFTWYLTPPGSLQYNNNTIDSGVDYDQTNTFYCHVSKREIRYNSVKVKGSLESGTQIESDWQEDEALKAEYNIRKLEITIPWIDLKANADTMGASLLALLKEELTFAEIHVRDTTKGMIQPGETITFSHSVKITTEAQFKINGVRYNYKDQIAEYLVSSDTRYNVENFKESTQKQLEEQITQVLSFASEEADHSIHDNEAGEINAIDGKADPHNDDIFIIEDSEDSWNKKKLTKGNLQSDLSITEAQISDLGSYLENISEDASPQLGGDLDLTDYEILLDSTPGSDHTASGLKASFTAGENLVFGNCCYLKSDGKMWKSQADASATMPIMAMALATINADASGEFLIYGIVRDDTWNWTVGGLIYAYDDASGALIQTAPSDAGDQVQVVGVATHADRMLFNPNLELVEI